MWKKILAGLGIIILLVLAVLGYGLYKMHVVDNETHPIADEMIKNIAASWQKDVLLRYSHPEALKAMQAQHITMDEATQIYAKLGKMTEFKGCNFINTTSFSGLPESYVIALYQCRIRTEKSDATITLRLRRDNGGQWQILGFHVDSPLFKQLLMQSH